MDGATDEENYTIYSTANKNGEYVKIVMQTNYCVPNYGAAGNLNTTKHLIWDLNGYNLTFGSGKSTGFDSWWNYAV